MTGTDLHTTAEEPVLSTLNVDGTRRWLRISSQHDHVESELTQRLQCRRRTRFDGICDRDDPGKLPIHRGEHDRAATILV